MLRRPEGLDRIIEYSKTSFIPSQFADVVDIVRQQVYNSRNRDPNLSTETANRLFRFKHPFKHDLTATYALWFGSSVGLLRAFQAIAPEGRSIDEANTIEEFRLKEKIYDRWRWARNCEFNVTSAGYFLPEFIIYRIKVFCGLEASSKDLQAVPIFLEEYFSQQPNVRHIILLAQK